ncbi:hypothetical protein JQK88_33470 [Mesorhizobium caraganae]|uniref:hypothetical protein n=1 Tax=Mesorhizobium caraganae TaxID=483206 RepID=UPI00193A6B68|nr:hypothetical protein [Mesorhizobium caraganae]MBM2716007.1 hypothetical protein [Mesorhizobium caraganae]
MTTFDFRPTLNAPDDDPYLWLEDVEGERALAWAASQSARTLGHFGGTQFVACHLRAQATDVATQAIDAA